MNLVDVTITIGDAGAAVEAWDAEIGELVRFTFALPAAPFSGFAGLRSAYQRGFARRVKEITGARETPNPEPPYKAFAHRQAWVEGYLEADAQAARREVVDV